jgi:predicted nucleotidyltransferase
MGFESFPQFNIDSESDKQEDTTKEEIMNLVDSGKIKKQMSVETTERPPYEVYESKSKAERKEIVSASGVLERKRFLLSNSPEIKKRLHKIQEIIYEMKEKYPEIISACIFGSMTKGYANKESDIDMYLILDQEKLDKLMESKERENDEECVSELDYRLAHDLKLQPEQITNVLGLAYSKKSITESIKKGNFRYTPQLFLMSIGRDIEGYRKAVLDELEKEGSEGEKDWRTIVDRLIEFENIGLPNDLREKRRKFYPQTIAEAKKYFLHEEPELIKKASA